MKTQFVNSYTMFVCLFLTLSLAHANYGSPKAKSGGTFYVNLGSEPTDVHPLSSKDAYATSVQGYVMETLLSKDVETNEYQPLLAESWDISKDGMAFTFKLRKGAKWHDGKPVTIEDVKFSYEAIVHPKDKYHTAVKRPYFENVKEAKIIDKQTIKFIIKKKYFNNFLFIAASMYIIPRHIYENPTKKQKRKLNKTLTGSGPYRLTEFKRGQKIILRRNKNWWGNNVAQFKGEYNAKKIHMRFLKDESTQIMMLEKGKVDYDSLQTEAFVKKTKGPKWGKSVFKVKYQNKAPRGYAFIGWNLKHPILKDKNVRIALGHLLDRDELIKKYRYSMSRKATGPLYIQSPYANQSVKPIEFSIEKALEKLRKAGWKDTDGDKVLDKVINGKKEDLIITILEPSSDFEKYLTHYKEDAKKAGVVIKIKKVEWNNFISLINERKFTAVRLAWSGGALEWDPKQLWHSASIKNRGSNFVSYSNPTVDKLIDEARVLMDRKKRKEKLNKVYKLIAEDAPYAFLFNDVYSFYAHSKKMKRTKDTYKYGVGVSYWWIEK